MLSFLAVSLFQLVLMFSYRLVSPGPDSAAKWRMLYLLGTILLALLWVSFPNLFLSQQVTDSLALNLAIIALTLLISVLLLTVDALNTAIYLMVILLAPLNIFLYPGAPLSENLWILIGSYLLVLFLIAFWSFTIRQRNLVLTANRLLLMRRLTELENQLVQASGEINEQGEEKEDVERKLSIAKESASMAKTEFLAMMSHEIRTPLNGILPIMEILHETTLDTEQRQLVNTALNSSQLLLGIINNILDFSKIEAGKLELETIEIDLRDLIGSVTSLMKSAADRRGLRINYLMAPDVPSGVRGDPIRLRQILTNLVSNAIKFTADGEVAVEVTQRSASRTDVELMFAVRDTGIGMSDELTGRLFKAFSQADASTTRIYGGTGLGLIICKRLTELMGGRIGVKSVEGKGSVFWFVLPLRKSLNETPSQRRDLQGSRVLVVANENEDYRVIKNSLTDWGVLHERAEDARDALAKFKSSANLGESWAYEAIILDEKNLGREVNSLLIEIDRLTAPEHVKLLIIGAMPYLKKSVSDEDVEYLETPITAQDLLSRLNQLFDVEEVLTHKYTNVELMGAHSMPDQQYSWDDQQRPRESTNIPMEHSSVGRVFQLPQLKGHVLVVEDNPINLAVVDKILKKLGIDTTHAVDGLAALGVVQKGGFDLILMDCQMPRLDGYKATKAIRERERQENLSRTPIIAMTANAMPGDREKCLNSGMDDYLAKPIKPAGIRDMMEQWLTTSDKAASMSGKSTASANETVAMTEDQIPIVDEAIINELFEIMEEQTLTLINSYLINSRPQIEKIEAATKNFDLEALLLPAHSLKSSSANVGAMAVSTLAEQIELKAREGLTEGIEQACRELLLCYEVTADRLTALCK